MSSPVNFSSLTSLSTISNTDQLLVRIDNSLSGTSGFGRITKARLLSSVDLTSLSANWQSTYTTVSANSGVWNNALTIFKQVSSTSTPNNLTNAYAISVILLSSDVDFAIVAKGTGATLANIPDNTATGGNKRGPWATDLQKLRADETRVAAGSASVICGGGYNTVNSEYSVVVGGFGNTIDSTSTYSTVGGGSNNSVANSVQAVIAGGVSNQVKQTFGTIGGGSNNICDGPAASIGGGANNIIIVGEYSTIAGGYFNTLSGNFSSAVGSYNSDRDLSNVHLLGSNLSASQANFTYVNNISSQGIITGTLSAATYVATITSSSNTNYVLQLTDASKTIIDTASTTTTYSIPANSVTAFAIGTQIIIIQGNKNASNYTILSAGVGVTINSYMSSLSLGGNYAAGTLIKTDTNTWYLIGNLA